MQDNQNLLKSLFLLTSEKDRSRERDDRRNFRLRLWLLLDRYNYPQWELEEFFDVRLRITDFLSLIARTYANAETGIDRIRTLQSLGEYLTHIGNLPLPQFEELIQILWLENSSQKMAYLDFLLDYYGSQPDFWARDVEQLKQILRISSIEQKAYIPLDLPDSCPEENPIKYFRNLVSDFGKLLIWWSTIVKLTAELSSDDVALVRTLG